MKKLLPISVCLNVGLAGGLICMLLLGRPQNPAASAVRMVATSPPENPATGASRPALTSTQPEPFRWSQLDAKDYHLYVKNLRGIGCPEATLYAIVSADVHAVYHQRIQSVEQQLAELDNAGWFLQAQTLGTKETLQAELQKMPDEEAAKIADLLGYKLEPQHSEVMTAQMDAPRRRNQSLSSPTMPLVMRDVDLKELNLNPQQIQVINDVRQSFLDDIGGSNQDPNDPGYYQRWLKAQPEADDMLRGMLGSTIFQNYQLAAGGNSDK